MLRDVEVSRIPSIKDLDVRCEKGKCKNRAKWFVVWTDLGDMFVYNICQGHIIKLLKDIIK